MPKVTELTLGSGIDADDLVAVVKDPDSSPSTVKVPLSALPLYAVANTPAASNDAVREGKFWFDDDYIYVATANNTIKRASLSSF